MDLHFLYYYFKTLSESYKTSLYILFGHYRERQQNVNIMTTNMLIIILTFFILMQPCTCNSTNLRYNHNRLKQYLDSKPFKKDPPYYEVGSVLDIVFLFCLVAILDIDEAKQIYTFTAFFGVSWQDPELTWNASEFGGISQVMLDPHSIWTPNLVFGNGIDRIRVFNGDFDISVHHSGNITATTSDIFKVTCSINVYKYPFDTQSCSLQITAQKEEPWRFHAVYLDMPLQELFATNNEWYLVSNTGVKSRVWNSSSFPTDGTFFIQVAEFTMTLKRKYLFYIVTTIIPMFLLSLLASLVFLLPPSSGDKMCYLISIFVSHTVFLNYVNETMPRTSDSLSLFELYLSFILLHCSLALLATLLVLRAYNKWQNSTQSQNSVSPLSELNDAVKPEVFKVHNSSEVNTSSTKMNANKRSKGKRLYMTLDIGFFLMFLTSAVAFPIIIVTYL